MYYMTNESHSKLIEELLLLSRKITDIKVKVSDKDFEFTSLIVCFGLHVFSSAEVILNLYKSMGEFFPATTGYVISRTMFEAIINARYISLEPEIRANQFIQYCHVNNKKHLDVLLKHKDTKNLVWKEYINKALCENWNSKKGEIENQYGQVKKKYTQKSKKGKMIKYRNWSGKTIRAMALDVDHEVEYDILYSELSSFVHTDVRLADRFLKFGKDNPYWSTRSGEYDIGNVLRHTATFLSCYLNLLADNFTVFYSQDIQNCWQSCADWQE